jgi:5-dehydro-2-deoxygluconokinase
MKTPCFIFAIDHRPILAKACQERGLPEEPIVAFKQLAVDALCRARDNRPELSPHLAILLDDTYGEPAIARARARGLSCGQPVERGGVIPFAFARDDWERAIVGPKPAFIKARFDGSPDAPPTERAAQEEKLVTIARACQAAGVPFMPEPLLTPAPRSESERPALLSRWIGELREKGVQARWWKVEGFEDPSGARAVADSLAPGEGLLILGKSAGPEQLRRWFAVTSGVDHFEGFAVGRTIFWEPFLAYLDGRSATDATLALERRFLAVVDLFRDRA